MLSQNNFGAFFKSSDFIGFHYLTPLRIRKKAHTYKYMENNTAKHFVLQLGSLITLYLSIAFLLVLLFNIINLLYPDAMEAYYQIESSREGVRWGIAMLLVFFPTYLILTRKVNQVRRQDIGSTYSGFTKWLVYLSLLVGGGVLLGDLVAVILAFLNGEITTRFILKAGVLLVVVGAAFYYYLQDARGYWTAREKMSIYYAGAMSAVVFLSLALGFTHIETPAQVREMKLDETQVMDLQNMQYRIEDYARVNNTLPAAVEELYVGVEAPVAPEDREAYSYKTTEKGFELCATFAYPSQNPDIYSYPADVSSELTKTMAIKGGNNWDHKDGRYCFERVVTENGSSSVNTEVPIKVVN